MRRRTVQRGGGPGTTLKRWRTSVAARLRCVRDGGERGYIGLYVIAMMMGLFALAGLVVDGGNAIAAREQAADLSEQAARAGADALSPSSLRGANPGGLSATPAGARAAADRVLATGGVSGTVTVNGDNVRVTVVIHKPTTILSAFGMNQISGSATASATAIHGTTTGSG